MSAKSSTVIGTVRRVVQRPVSTEDRSQLDSLIHARIDSERGIEEQIERAKKALGKLRARQTDLRAAIDELHRAWKAPTIEEVAECRVERTTTEVIVRRTDTSEIVCRRALTRDEHEALADRLPGIDGREVHHPELDADTEAVQLFEERVALLKQEPKTLTFEDALAEVDAEDDEEPTGKSKGKAKGKGKGKGKDKQTDMFVEGEDS